MKMMKTFDMSDMPSDIEAIWNEYACENGKRGYLSFWVEDDMFENGEDNRFFLLPLANWLIEQGAEIDEHILVEFDW
jgi:hypothetical protein